MPEIIIALDNLDLKTAEKFIKLLQPYVWGFKINDLLLEHGMSIIKFIKNFNTKVFCDPKLYDIPNTIANAVRKLAKHEADIITVHATGGIAMLQAAFNEAGNKIFAVTTLTSNKDRSNVTNCLAICREANIKNIVCAVQDLSIAKGFTTIVPGIRVTKVPNDDQQCKVDKVIAANYVVVGRPVTLSKDPLQVVLDLVNLFSCRNRID